MGRGQKARSWWERGESFLIYLGGGESLDMKTAVCLILPLAIFALGLHAQKQVSSPSTTQPYEIKYEINISPGVAEKLLIHKVDPDACPHIAMAAHVIGTVVVAFDIDKNGNVLRPSVVSGPATLQKPTLDAVRKYKYKPYLLNGQTVVVGTTVSVQIDTVRDCRAE
jgi:TonB family protein